MNENQKEKAEAVKEAAKGGFDTIYNQEPKRAEASDPETEPVEDHTEPDPDLQAG